MEKKQSQQQIKKFRQFFQIFFIDFSAGAHTSCEGAREEKEGGRERGGKRARLLSSVLCMFWKWNALSLFFGGLSFLYFVYFSIFLTTFCAHHSFRCISFSRRFKLATHKAERANHESGRARAAAYVNRHLTLALTKPPAECFLALPHVPHSHLSVILCPLRVANQSKKRTAVVIIRAKKLIKRNCKKNNWIFTNF